MVSIVQTSIRKETSQLNVSKGGSTSLYVDTGYSEASDFNDGYSWDRPFRTISAALTAADPWTEIWIKTGTYAENLTIPHENIVLHGIVQDGADRVVIQPPSGTAITMLKGYCELEGLAVVTDGGHGVVAQNPGQKIHDCYFSISNSTLTTYSALWLNDADSAFIWNNYFQGNGADRVIGVRVDGGSFKVGIHGNYFTGFGGAVNVGYGVGLNDAQNCLVSPFPGLGDLPNYFINNNVGVYCYVQAGYRGHSIVNNVFGQNVNFDVYDLNVLGVSGILVRSNHYIYNGWFTDRNHDGIADLIVSCGGTNYDFAPMAGVHAYSTPPVPRLGTL